MKFLFFSFLFLAFSNFCAVEESIIYEDVSKFQKFTQKFRKKNVNKSLKVCFGYGFGDKMKIEHNDSIIMSMLINNSEDPGISIYIEKPIGTLKLTLENKQVCTSTELLSNYDKLYITRFKNKWYFTYSYLE